MAMGTIASRMERRLGTLVVRGAHRERWLASCGRLDAMPSRDRRMEVMEQLQRMGGPGAFLPRITGIYRAYRTVTTRPWALAIGATVPHTRRRLPAAPSSCGRLNAMPSWDRRMEQLQRRGGPGAFMVRIPGIY